MFWCFTPYQYKNSLTETVDMMQLVNTEKMRTGLTTKGRERILNAPKPLLRVCNEQCNIL